jgi:hypothetical protein
MQRVIMLASHVKGLGYVLQARMHKDMQALALPGIAV